MSQKVLDYKTLPPIIRDWLSSETVTDIIVEINKKYDVWGEEVVIIPRAITGLVVGKVTPENFAKEISAGLRIISREDINEITSQIANRVLKQLGPTLKSLYGVDITRISLLPPKQPPTPTARTMSIEGNLSKTVRPVQQPIAPKTTAQIAQEQQQQQLRARTMNLEGGISDPIELAKRSAAAKAQAAPAAQVSRLQARTMEIQGSFDPLQAQEKNMIRKMVDIKKPQSIEQKSGPTAQVTQMQGSLTPVERASEKTTVPQTPTPPSIKKPVQAADVLETTAPIGLSEVVPQAPINQTPVARQEVPQTPTRPLAAMDRAPLTSPIPTAAAPTTPHEMTEYHDEHPVSK